jgi:hypothetical protein
MEATRGHKFEAGMLTDDLHRLSSGSRQVMPVKMNDQWGSYPAIAPISVPCGRDNELVTFEPITYHFDPECSSQRGLRSFFEKGPRMHVQGTMGSQSRRKANSRRIPASCIEASFCRYVIERSPAAGRCLIKPGGVPKRTLHTAISASFSESI